MSLLDLVESLDSVIIKRNIPSKVVKGITVGGAKIYLKTNALLYDASNLETVITRDMFAKIKAVLIARSKERDRDHISDGIFGAVAGGQRRWFNRKYPHAEYNHAVQDDKLVVQIWPYGKPGGDND